MSTWCFVPTASVSLSRGDFVAFMIIRTMTAMYSTGAMPISTAATCLPQWGDLKVCSCTSRSYRRWADSRMRMAPFYDSPCSKYHAVFCQCAHQSFAIKEWHHSRRVRNLRVQHEYVKRSSWVWRHGNTWSKTADEYLEISSWYDTWLAGTPEADLSAICKRSESIETEESLPESASWGDSKHNNNEKCCSTVQRADTNDFTCKNWLKGSSGIGSSRFRPLKSKRCSNHSAAGGPIPSRTRSSLAASGLLCMLHKLWYTEKIGQYPKGLVSARHQWGKSSGSVWDLSGVWLTRSPCFGTCFVHTKQTMTTCSCSLSLH